MDAAVPAVHVLLGDGVHQLGTAIGQVAATGSDTDKSVAAQVLLEARRALCELLAASE
ncbi:hypothetical protein ABZX93_26720 [Streptomyces sp. NPDC006632]|uniref:hypothetical protein n=1 Tax=Streptomyces sp. NPDC006632 TaxID=3157182 RepID=UPI0033B69ED9